MYNIYMFCDNLCYKVNLRYLKLLQFKRASKKYTLLPWQQRKLVYFPNMWVNGEKGGYKISSYSVEIIPEVVKTYDCDTWSKKMYPFKKLCAMYSKEQIKQWLIKKVIILIPCGACEKCANAKRGLIHSRVKSQMKKTKYNYFLTITFSNDKIRVLCNENQRKQLEELDDTTLSYISYLSKNDAKNIIKNIKNKLNNFYKEKVKVHYLMCGEYGENTKRAHYHILLMLNRPLPDLKRVQCEGLHYTCWIFESKQYGLYDLQLANDKDNTSKYITKYLTKGSNKSNTNKLNLLQEKQLSDQIKNNELGKDYLYYREELIELINEDEKNRLALKPNGHRYILDAYTYQQEFIKYSRSLGISSNDYENLSNGVLSYYYKTKIKDMYLKLNILWLQYNRIPKLDYSLNDITNLCLFSYLLSYLQLICTIDERRIINIKKYDWQGVFNRREVKYNIKDDIF